MNRFRLLLTLAGLAAAGLAAWLLLARAPLRLDLVAASRGRIEAGFTEEGRSRIRHHYALAAPVAGQLRRITLEPGDAVKAGDTVAWLEPARGALLDGANLALTRAQRDGAVAAERAAAERLRAAESAAAMAATQAGRVRTLRRQGVASAAELDAAEDLAKRGDAERLAASGDLGVARQQRVALDALLAQQGKHDGEALALVAPIDGVVLRRSQDSAVPVTAGQPLLEFGRPDDLEIVVEALSQDAVKLAPGMSARVERWGGDGALAAKLARVEPAGFTKISALGVEEQRTLVRLDLVDPPARWARLGDAYRVEVAFVIDAADDALTVPSGAVLRDGAGWAVYRIDGGRARRTPVTLGVRASESVQILAGLRDGDRVVGHPDERLSDGLRVSGDR